MIRKRRTAFAEGFGKMNLKAISEIALTMFLLSMLPLTFSVQPVAADGTVDWWPMFHHDLNHTGYSTSTAPNTNHTIWNYTTGDRVVSSPAVADGKVFVGSDDWKVYCLDASTGAHIWNYTTGSDVDSSPAVADGKVYVGSWDNKVYCLNASSGTHIWNYTT
ncbi:MAG: PQQ-binding-like beta-propeller repeat protein, partial [Candidatus Bathyarchaeota archaeon]